MPRDDDRLLATPDLQFGSGVVGVCDVCGKRQAVVILQKERFKLCVLDFLNKTWSTPGLKAGAPLPLYRSERIWYPTDASGAGKAPAILLSPTKVVKHPAILFAPDIYGLTTSILDGAIRMAREGFEVMLPDVAKTGSVGPLDHLSMRLGAHLRGGVALDSRRVTHLRTLYADALRYLRTRDMVDPEKSAVVGLSYGGSLAVALAGSDSSLTATVVAYPRPLRDPEYLKLLSAPVLFVDAGADSSARKARGQFEALRGTVDVRFVDAPSARHGFLARDLRAYRIEDAEAAWTAVLAFLRERLLPAPPKPPAPKVVAAPPTAPPAAPVAPAPKVETAATAPSVPAASLAA